MHRNQILRRESDLRLWAFRFLIFFAVPFSPFLFFLLQWLAFCWACLQLKKLPRKHHWDGHIWPWSSHACVVAGNFAPTFSLFEHFCAYLRLHKADHADLGIIGKIFSSCRSWPQMMPILVQSDDVRSGRKVQALHGRLWPAWESMG